VTLKDWLERFRTVAELDSDVVVETSEGAAASPAEPAAPPPAAPPPGTPATAVPEAEHD
jgi:hypothetical protein